MQIYDAKSIPVEVHSSTKDPDAAGLSRAFIQMTAHSKRCLESTQEVARLLGQALYQPEQAVSRICLVWRSGRRSAADFEKGFYVQSLVLSGLQNDVVGG